MAAQTLPLTALKELQTAYAEVEKSDVYAGAPVPARVSYPTGREYQFRLPFTIQGLNYLVVDGSYVGKGQKIALLQGREVHHYLDEFDAAKALFTLAKKQFEDSDAYKRNGVVLPESWYAIAERYYAAKLKVEHFAHTAELLLVEGENIYLRAPDAGFLMDYSRDGQEALNAEAHFASLIPADEIRLTGKLSDSQLEGLSGFEVAPGCSAAFDYSEERGHSFWRNVWSAPLAPDCKLVLGQQLSVTPKYRRALQAVPKSALFQLDNKHYVAVKSDDALVVTEVEPQVTSANKVFLAVQPLLEGQSVLSRSVSAVQGILMALGEE